MALGEYFDSVFAAARTGAAWAWETIFRDLAGPIAVYARHHGAPEPEDVLQEVLLSAAKDIHRFSGDEGDFRAWIFTIARRRVADALRADYRQVPREEGNTEIAAQQHWLGDVEAEAMGAMSMLEVGALIRGLTVSQRDVVLLRVVADLSVADAAKVLDKSEGAIRVLQARALNELRAKLRRESEK